MKVYKEISLGTFDAWGNAPETLRIVGEANKINELEDLLQECEPADGWTETAINDILWFESDWIFQMLGIDPDDYEEED